MGYVNQNAYHQNVIFLVIFENQASERVELNLHISSQNEHSRWIQALVPPSENEVGETIYEEWDCLQLICTEAYTAVQPDEMSIEVDDVVKVTKKTNDGWCFGERMGDGSLGWIPQQNCDEIEDEHVRTRNMKNQFVADKAAAANNNGVNNVGLADLGGDSVA